MKKNLLLLSSSRVGQTDYLVHALPLINKQLCAANVTEVLFIPFAGVTMSYQAYKAKVEQAMSAINIKVSSIDEFDDPKLAVEQAQAIVVGGGNTFRLLERLYHFDVITSIQKKVAQGTPYIGWSAGSNIAGLSIRTTNDMPIIEPPSFAGLALVGVQLNPHYTDYNPPGFNGETREQRLAEFMVLNPDISIIGIEEGSGLKVDNDNMKLVLGNNVSANGFLFKQNQKFIISTEDDLSELIKEN
ncbi:dipeptidase PepE [Thalassotalea sp. G2M2-11]|uniref:dipeptidase PepE n=1 Tax=Thalassotalea sp. G2M2-11 TaxID=2787627 RepID=UPI0019CF6F2D|nr:dipeptidase PepE [Thalassotalea sp. G2M2-11]